MIKITQNITLLLTLVCLSSCMVTFTAPPGSPRTAFPQEMQGAYMAIDKSKKVRDTIWLKIAETKTSSNDKFLDRTLQLSDSTTLSHLGDYYFFSIRNTDSAGVSWLTFPLKVTGDALYVHTLLQGKQEKQLKKYLRKEGKDSRYIMDNEPFKHFCEGKLKKRKALKFKRIK